VKWIPLVLYVNSALIKETIKDIELYYNQGVLDAVIAVIRMLGNHRGFVLIIADLNLNKIMSHSMLSPKISNKTSFKFLDNVFTICFIYVKMYGGKTSIM
jgi:hypothetical protein